jgi:carbon starvation protein
VNSVLVAVISIAWLVAAYFLYGRFIEHTLIRPDDSSPTPAHRLHDGVDYYPSRPILLFGHHFASIAGAGPIVGPVIAVAAFGYGASLLWILVGVVLVGAVHDYTTLMISARHDAKSIPDVTGRVIGNRARVMFQVFVWIALVFIIAVFANAAKRTLIGDPRVVIPAFGLIPLAMVFGLIINRFRVPLWAATLLSLAALVGLFYAGMAWPVALPFAPEVNEHVWLVILILYGLVAAVLPVWLLLQPRDYLGYWILAVGMVAGFVGLCITHRPINAPAFTGMVSDKGPVWPMLFILVACGAVSGFHSLVSSGTTAKQLDRESHGLPIGFGAMLTEGGLAVLALLAVSAGLSWKAGGTLPTLQSFMAPGAGGPIAAFATGFGEFTAPLMGSLGALFGMTMINAFVLTTLDTAVRISRFITSELGGPVFKPLNNRYLSASLVAAVAYALAATGSVTTLWKMFGALNQLVAALAMLVVTVYLLGIRRPTRYTLLPALFMLLTTCGALVWQGWGHLTAAEPNYTLAVASLVLLLLAFYVGANGLIVLRRGAPPAS